MVTEKKIRRVIDKIYKDLEKGNKVKAETRVDVLMCLGLITLLEAYDLYEEIDNTEDKP